MREPNVRFTVVRAPRRLSPAMRAKALALAVLKSYWRGIQLFGMSVWPFPPENEPIEPPPPH
jgi:hypothetical protein